MALDKTPLHVEVVYSPNPELVECVSLQIESGMCVAQAIEKSGLLTLYPHISQATCGIWGRACERTHVLRDLDRVELYRPIKIDPKEARRKRFLQQKKLHSQPRGKNP